MTSATYKLLRKAIRQKLQIVATYDGHLRELCPHVLGIKHARQQALFYQFGGTSSSGPLVPDSPDNWRCIPVDGLSDVRIRSGPWHTSGNYVNPQTCVDEIDVRVAL